MIRKVIISLYDDADYKFIIPLEGVSYQIRLYYNERLETWIIDLSYSDGTPIVLGQALVPEFPLFFDYTIERMSGYFYLAPIGKFKNETLINPFELRKYYTLSYYYDDGEE